MGAPAAAPPAVHFLIRVGSRWSTPDLHLTEKWEYARRYGAAEEALDDLRVMRGLPRRKPERVELVRVTMEVVA